MKILRFILIIVVVLIILFFADDYWQKMRINGIDYVVVTGYYGKVIPGDLFENSVSVYNGPLLYKDHTYGTAVMKDGTKMRIRFGQFWDGFTLMDERNRLRYFVPHPSKRDEFLNVLWGKDPSVNDTE